MLCLSAAFAVVRWLAGWVSVSHIRVLGGAYVKASVRYGHSCYGMRIGNRTQSFKWYHFR